MMKKYKILIFVFLLCGCVSQNRSIESYPTLTLTEEMENVTAAENTQTPEEYSFPKKRFAQRNDTYQENIQPTHLAQN